MVRATVAFALVFFTCVNAAPAPRVIEITWLRDSSIDFDLSAGGKKAKGVLDGARHWHLDVPDKTADRLPEITVLENVHSGAGVILGAHVDIDKILSIGRSLKDKLLPLLEENVKEFISALTPY